MEYFYTTHHPDEILGPTDFETILDEVRSGLVPPTYVLSLGENHPWISLDEAKLVERKQGWLPPNELLPIGTDLPPDWKADLSGPRKVYKVLSQRDKWFSGRFDPPALEQALNDHAKQGWEVISITTASREGLLTGSGKDELIVVFSKTLQQ